MTPWTSARQASLSFTISQSLLKLKSIESMMPSNNLINGFWYIQRDILPSQSILEHLSSPQKETLYLLAISFLAPPPPPLNRFTICIPIGKIKRAGYRAIQGTFLRSKHQEVVEPRSPTQGVRVHTLSPHHEDERVEVREAPVRRCHPVATS